MSKENKVVNEVREVLSSIEVEVNNKQCISREKYNLLKEKLANLINDYISTINECDRLNSLETRLEDFIEIIGMMCNISVGSLEGLENLENTTNYMKEIFSSLKQK